MIMSLALCNRFAHSRGNFKKHVALQLIRPLCAIGAKVRYAISLVFLS